MVVRRWLLVAAIAVVVAGCTGRSESNQSVETSTSDLASSTTQEQRASSEATQRDLLEAARMTWVRAGIDAYQTRAVESRNHWSNGCEWITTVSANEPATGIVGPSSTSSYCSPGPVTAEMLHGRIANMMDSIDRFPAEEFGDHVLEVTYDDNGVPIAIEYDLINGEDEETSLRVRVITDRNRYAVPLDCDHVDRSVRNVPDGYRVVSGSVALPDRAVISRGSLVEDHHGRLRAFSEVELFLRPGSRVELSVAPEFEDDVLIRWGADSKAPSTSVIVDDCPRTGDWLVFTGGIYTAESACVRLVIEEGFGGSGEIEVPVGTDC